MMPASCICYQQHQRHICKRCVSAVDVGVAVGFGYNKTKALQLIGGKMVTLDHLVLISEIELTKLGKRSRGKSVG